MKFKISEQIFEKFPNFICGVVVCANTNNEGIDESVLNLLKDEEAKIRKDFVLENLSQALFFSSWRRAYSAFGTEPSKFKCSSEALVRRILKGDSIRHINKLVDSYNYISLKYRTPVGGEDLGGVKGGINLKFSDGTESFSTLGSSEKEIVEQGEVIYADDEGAICRRWNWRESERTKLTERTKEAFLVIDALPPITNTIVATAVDEFAGLLKRACEADIITTAVLDCRNTTMSW